MHRTFLAVVTSWLTLSLTGTLSASTTAFDFNAAVPGTLNDATGSGTGFTDRLPGTGSAIPSSDPKMTLDAGNSQLIVGSTYSGPNYAAAGFQNNAANLPSTDMPGLLLSGTGNSDFMVQAQFTNLRVDYASDQIGVFVGTSIDNMVRGGVYNDTPARGYQSGFQISQNGRDVSGNTVAAFSTFQPGDNGEFELGRINGVWSFSWQNLSNPSHSGTFDTFSVPGLDSQSNLYVGIFNLDTYGEVDGFGAPSTPYNAYLESFTVLTGASVPEPSSLVLAAFGLIGVVTWSCKKRRGPRS